jgi:hypothetical protein
MRQSDRNCIIYLCSLHNSVIILSCFKSANCACTIPTRLLALMNKDGKDTDFNIKGCIDCFTLMKTSLILATLALAMPTEEVKIGSLKVQSDRDSEVTTRRCVESGGYSDMDTCRKYHGSCKPMISCYTSEIVWVPRSTVIIRP